LAGIYLHIPFCKAKCSYCDFYSVATIKFKEEFVKAICKEIELQKNYLDGESIQTIYFGGGTPSLLDTNEIEQILFTVKKYFKVEENNEITLEANPDDLNTEYLSNIKSLGINRLSIGIQSFNDQDLKLMRRKHTENQALAAVKNAQKAGYHNLSVDLIYGLPDLNLERWNENIKQALKLDIQHISAYHLTIEPKTLFHKYWKQKKLNLPTEDESLAQFKLLREKLLEIGFLQYEISNFAKDGSISLHNTNYWMGVKYLGLGPSAHSYNLTSRQWNIQNLREYLGGILNGKLPKEKEILSTEDKFNEYLITSLRTMWGINTEILEENFGLELKNYFLKKSSPYLQKEFLHQNENNYSLTDNGIFISDHIIQELLLA